MLFSLGQTLENSIETRHGEVLGKKNPIHSQPLQNAKDVKIIKDFRESIKSTILSGKYGIRVKIKPGCD